MRAALQLGVETERVAVGVREIEVVDHALDVVEGTHLDIQGHKPLALRRDVRDADHARHAFATSRAVTQFASPATNSPPTHV